MFAKFTNFTQGRIVADELKDQRVVTMMSPSEIEAIDEWMFKNRIKSRGEAIRRLCYLGMNAEDDIMALLRALIEGLDAEHAMMERLKTGDLEGVTPLEVMKVGQDFLREVYAIVGSRLMEGVIFRTAPSAKEGIAVSKDISERLKKLGSTKKQVDTFVNFINGLKELDKKPKKQD